MTLLLLAGSPVPADAHGDALLVDDVIVLEPGASVAFDGELHYHRLVGRVRADDPVRVSLVADRSGETVEIGTGTALSFNHLVRCCDEAWAPYTLLIENPGPRPVAVTARAMFVHDDLAVMVDGAESGTRASIAVLGLAWAALAWRGFRRGSGGVTLRRSVIGLAALSVFVLVVGGFASSRYGVVGAPGLVAGNADVPILPMNPTVSRASLLMGLLMVGWALVGRSWARAWAGASRVTWTTMGVALAGAVMLVAVLMTAAYGGPWVQAAWVVCGTGPILAVMVASNRLTHRGVADELPGAEAVRPRRG
jgi:hypothetical protein